MTVAAKASFVIRVLVRIFGLLRLVDLSYITQVLGQGLVKGEKFCFRNLNFYIQDEESTSTVECVVKYVCQKLTLLHLCISFS